MFYFNCFWKYASTRRVCPECRTTLPDSTYEFFCTIFVPEGIESIDPNTGEKEVMEAKMDQDELESGRGRHVLRNDVDILTNNESRAFALLEMNKAFKLWRADNVLPGVIYGETSSTCISKRGTTSRMDIRSNSWEQSLVIGYHPTPPRILPYRSFG
ncbi:hypothetical protein R1sor_009140 [Riccia sorocarpa]|uniref:Uncharacterized protein n=1 Tax=Riccia sorocarpa TaxID=122646 RepID=A0ABD3H6W9_9MARC